VRIPTAAIVLYRFISLGTQAATGTIAVAALLNNQAS
jgi:hypothetical protein